MSCCSAAISNPQSAELAIINQRKLEEANLLSGSIALENGNFKTDLIVPEIHCAGCISTIENGLADIPSISQVRANLTMKKVSIIWDSNIGSILDIAASLRELGFENHPCDPDKDLDIGDRSSNGLLLALAVAGFAAANIMLLSVSVWSGADKETAQLFHLISGLIAVPVIAFSGQPFFRSALKALSTGRLNMDVPISLAVLLALAMSLYEGLTGGEEAYFDASVTLLFFLLIGRYLDSIMRNKARGAVRRLASISAKNGVRVMPNKELSNVPVHEIKPGMVLRIFTGERFPVDGIVKTGATDVDRSHVTGESLPVSVAPGGQVEAGTLNVLATVDIQATSDAEHSFLGEMQRMMQEAEKGRSGYIRIADRMAQIYAPAVHLLALIAFFAWIILTGGDWHTSVYIAIAVLIITCPCALGLAVPVAHVIAANRLMQYGILMRNGEALERLAEANDVVFDKTGTLTCGEVAVSKHNGDLDKSTPLIMALAVSSSHPISKALAKYLPPVAPDILNDTREIPGYGIEANYQGRKIRFGKQEWVLEIADSSTECVNEHSASFAMENENAIHFDISDTLRPDAGIAVNALKESGLELAVLSGDQPSKVQSIADILGVGAYKARQKPSDKIDFVKARQNAGRKVLMVGDGINDAPALAAGHVSMVPASAADVGRHAADFVFTRKSLAAVPFAYDTAKRTASIVKQNFGLAIAYNCVAVPLAMAGYITPLIAAIAMSASSIVVVANSFRISAFNRQYDKRKAKVVEDSRETEVAIQ